MSANGTLTAPSGKRIWAGGFDALAVIVAFLGVAGVAEGVGFDLKFWWVFAVIFFAYHFAALALRQGRTLGKTAIEIVVVASNGGSLSNVQCLARSLYRTLPFIVLGLPDAKEIGVVLLLLVLSSELHLLLQPSLRRTLADIVARTLVVAMPPLQPHRAPAVPMYSSGDTEFGHPPQKPAKGESRTCTTGNRWQLPNNALQATCGDARA